MRRPQVRNKLHQKQMVHMRCAMELRLLGMVLIAAGLVLLFLCIPGWAWAALIGAGMVVVGWLLVRN